MDTADTADTTDLEPVDALVVGSGPAGLSSARELAARGIRVTVLERGDVVGAAWTGRYDALRFNTGRRGSALPGVPFPRDFGQFPGRDQYVGYLRDYRDRFGIDVRTRTAVSRVDRHPSGGGWLVRCDDGTTRWARHVVVATGMLHSPVIPDWPGRASYTGTLLHSADYRNAAAFAGRDVLVVGAGCSGIEIAHELARSGAGRVRMSVRTPPNILPRSLGGRPGDEPAPLLMRLPSRWADATARVIRRAAIGDLAPYGLPVPADGPFAELQRGGTSPTVVDRPVVESIRSGAVTVVPAVRDLWSGGAVLADGASIRVDAIVAATGYSTGLESVVGHLGVLGPRGMPRRAQGDQALPGLWFVGYVPRPALTGYVGVLAAKVADLIAVSEVGMPARSDDDVVGQLIAEREGPARRRSGRTARATASRPAPGGWSRRAWRTPTSRGRAASPR